VEDVLHARLTASEEARCERLTRTRPELSGDFRAALNHVRQSDRRRSRYLKRFYHVDWEDPTLYHLTLNTEKTGVELAAQMIASGARALEGPAPA
jgi:cytidylate kinase